MMANNSTFERVRTIIIDQLGVETDAVTMEANFRDDLDADSLDLVELIMAFEEEFGGGNHRRRRQNNHHRRRRCKLPQQRIRQLNLLLSDGGEGNGSVICLVAFASIEFHTNFTASPLYFNTRITETTLPSIRTCSAARTIG